MAQYLSVQSALFKKTADKTAFPPRCSWLSLTGSKGAVGVVACYVLLAVSISAETLLVKIIAGKPGY